MSLGRGKLYALIGVVNLHCVIPAFVYPVFSDGKKTYIEDGKFANIRSFREVDQSFLANLVPVQSPEPFYRCGSKTVYAFMYTSNDVVCGDFDQIMKFLIEYRSRVKDEVLLKEIQDFLLAGIRRRIRKDFIYRKKEVVIPSIPSSTQVAIAYPSYTMKARYVRERRTLHQEKIKTYKALLKENRELTQNLLIILEDYDANALCRKKSDDNRRLITTIGDLEKLKKEHSVDWHIFMQTLCWKDNTSYMSCSNRKKIDSASKRLLDENKELKNALNCLTAVFKY